MFDHSTANIAFSSCPPVMSEKLTKLIDSFHETKKENFKKGKSREDTKKPGF